MYKLWGKRFVDLIFAVLAFAIISPIFLIIAILLFFANNGKPFFLQKRPGKDERIFHVIKFKTMNDKKDNNGALLPDNLRITNIGSFVRKTSLDEIPQLLNVIAGNMSIIGPRPLLVKYLPHYNEEQKRRHEMRPGITGWAQVNGRNAISWEQKFEYDVWYIDNCSFALDVRIVMRTIYKVLKREGVYTDDILIMGPFTGTKKIEKTDS